MMNCELCGENKSMMYCESDQANLCWDCDSKVHSANFLVAKHSRNLLCHSCQNSTPWNASGPKLSPTFSLCNSCIQNPDPIEQIGETIEENYQTEADNDEDEYVSTDSEIDDYDDENQVVPLSSSPSSDFSPSPSPVRSVSSSGSYGDLSAIGDYGGGATAADNSSPWKRVRESDCLHFEDEEACSSSLLLEENKRTSSSIGFLRPMKVLRTNDY
ncbi:zinc finger protein HD1-like [Solanum lycopersicum]|uniref:zinc finger protein HD1-like n=1 Tax=Solanum lycopersicum TaxID=4081 RepID=UPI000E1C6900|nr:B-box zinc finger protein 19-like [Solanum lycopersicum]